MFKVAMEVGEFRRLLSACKKAIEDRQDRAWHKTYEHDQKKWFFRYRGSFEEFQVWYHNNHWFTPWLIESELVSKIEDSLSALNQSGLDRIEVDAKFIAKLKRQL